MRKKAKAKAKAEAEAEAEAKKEAMRDDYIKAGEFPRSPACRQAGFATLE